MLGAPLIRMDLGFDGSVENRNWRTAKTSQNCLLCKCYRVSGILKPLPEIVGNGALAAIGK